MSSPVVCTYCPFTCDDLDELFDHMCAEHQPTAPLPRSPHPHELSDPPFFYPPSVPSCHVTVQIDAKQYERLAARANAFEVMMRASKAHASKRPSMTGSAEQLSEHAFVLATEELVRRVPQ